MKFKIDKTVLEKFPDLVEVVPLIYGFNASLKREESVKILRLAEEQFKKNYSVESWENDEKVKKYRLIFKDFGAVDGAEPSHVALTKRILEGGQLPDINSLVDIYNSFSVKYLTPFGGENLDNTCGDLVLTVAEGGEKWLQIGGGKNKPAFKDELIWIDEMNVTCRSWNWRQCDRTKLTEESKNGYFIMDGFESNKEYLLKVAKEFVDYVTANLGGKGEIFVLDKNSPEFEIEFVNKKKSDFETEVKKPEVIKKEKKYYFLAKEIQEFLINKYPDFKMPVDHSANEKFGDFSVRGDFDLTELDFVEKTDKVAGFTNIWIKKEYLEKTGESFLKDGYRNELKEVLKNKKYLLEHTSPEPTKTLHIGHFRNNFIGLAIHNILEMLGAEVILDCIDNDRGMKICKTMWGYLILGNKSKVEKLGFDNFVEKFKDYKITDEEILKLSKDSDWKNEIINWINNPNDWYQPEDFGLTSDRFDNVLYSPASRACDLDENINNSVQEILREWEAENNEVRKLWRQIINWSAEGYARTYKRIGSFHDKVWHESDHYMEGKKWVEIGLQKGVFKKLDDGAILTNLKDYGLTDTIVIKRDGTSNYLTQDLQLTWLKVNTYPSDLYIWDIGNDQQLYLKQMYVVCEQLGIVPMDKLFHLNYGFVTLAGEKMSSRFGGVINGDDLLDELKAKLKEVILSSESGGKEVDIEEVSEKLAVGACKYGFLKVDRAKDIVYDIEKSVSIQGDSGPYLQYTYARAKSVMEKSPAYAKATSGKQISNFKFQNLNEFDENETPLLRYFYIFKEKVVEAAERYNPAVIAEYLLTLARKYNEFYGKCRIVGTVEEERRIFLTAVTAKILKDGLNLLGIETLEKM